MSIKQITIISFLFIIGSLMFIYAFDVPIPFRYKITGTNKGIIYKTDVLSGKTWVVSPKGEKELKPVSETIQSSITEPFPLHLLEFISLSSEESSYSNFAKAVIRNTNGQTAQNLVFKITHHENENSPEFDTEYKEYHDVIRAGDTITATIPIKRFDRKTYFKVMIYSATY